MRTRTLNQIAFFNLLINAYFLVILYKSLTINFYANKLFALFFDITWIPSIIALIIFPSILFLIYLRKKIKKIGCTIFLS